MRAATFFTVAAFAFAPTCTTAQRFVNGTCENGAETLTYQVISEEGVTCQNLNKQLGTSVDVATCEAAVVNNTLCSNIFMFSPSAVDPSRSTCACHLGNAPAVTCVAVSSHPITTTRIYSTSNDAFCQCSDHAQNGNIKGGQYCNLTSTSSVGFVNSLNELNDLVNTGSLSIEASRVSMVTYAQNVFDAITLDSAAVLLTRGFDGEASLAVGLFMDTEITQAQWEEMLVQSMSLSLTTAGYSRDTNNFKISSTVESDNYTCSCPLVDYPHSADCGNTCSSYIVNIIIFESRTFAHWELSLIIVACVLVMCAIGIGLSFVKREQKELQVAHPHKGDEENGVEMIKAF